MNKVAYISLGNVENAVLLCVLAQKFMPEGKRFGAVVWSQSGIGKNAVTDNLHNVLNGISTNPDWSTLDINVSAMSPEDLQGLPVADHATKQTSYYPTLKTNSVRGILRADEIDRPAYFQNLIALVKYAIDRTTTPCLPLDWFFLGLGNGVSDQHTVELTEHIKGRVCHLYVSTNMANYCNEMETYFQKRNTSDIVQKLFNMNPISTRDEFEDIAVYNPRTLEYADCILKAYKQFNGINNLNFSAVIFPCLAGVIGITLATELMKLLDIDGLPTLKQICNNPDKAMIVQDLSLRHKHITAMIDQAGKDCDKVFALAKYVLRIDSEQVRYSFERMILNCPNLAKLPEYIKWTSRLNT